MVIAGEEEDGELCELRRSYPFYLADDDEPPSPSL
jgi:hypothetical protein